MSPALSRQMSAAPIAILGVPFDNVTAAEAIRLIESMVDSRRPHYLITANVDFLVQARDDVELRRILFDAHLVLCDGTPLVWASRLLGNALPERVAGSDLAPLLMKVAAEKQYRVFFLGATPESCGRAMEKLRKKYPTLLIAGHYSPPFKKLLEMDHPEIRSRIAQAKPDLLFVSFGCPKQEKWISMHYQSLGVPVSVGVGATIDFLAGQVKRAPKWMQRCGAEWVFRLAQEPRRLFRRYMRDLWVFGWSILFQWYRMQLPSKRGLSEHASAPLRVEPDWQWLRLPARFDVAALRTDSAALEQRITGDRHCLLGMSCTEFIDSTAVGFLIRVHKRLRARGRELLLLAPSRSVQRTLKLMRLHDFFACVEDIDAAKRLIEMRAEEALSSVTQPTGPKPAVSWRGEITAANVEAVWRQTQTQLNEANRNEFFIDMTDVRFIDSSGLGLMVRAKRSGHAQMKDVRFTGLQPNVLNVLRLARLDEFLLKHSGYDSARSPETEPASLAGVGT